MRLGTAQLVGQVAGHQVGRLVLAVGRQRVDDGWRAPRAAPPRRPGSGRRTRRALAGAVRPPPTAGRTGGSGAAVLEGRRRPLRPGRPRRRWRLQWCRGSWPRPYQRGPRRAQARSAGDGLLVRRVGVAPADVRAPARPGRGRSGGQRGRGSAAFARAPRPSAAGGPARRRRRPGPRRRARRRAHMTVAPVTRPSEQGGRRTRRPSTDSVSRRRRRAWARVRTSDVRGVRGPVMRRRCPRSGIRCRVVAVRSSSAGGRRAGRPCRRRVRARALRSVVRLRAHPGRPGRGGEAPSPRPRSAPAACRCRGSGSPVGRPAAVDGAQPVGGGDDRLGGRMLENPELVVEVGDRLVAAGTGTALHQAGPRMTAQATRMMITRTTGTSSSTDLLPLQTVVTTNSAVVDAHPVR